MRSTDRRFMVYVSTIIALVLLAAGCSRDREDSSTPLKGGAPADTARWTSVKANYAIYKGEKHTARVSASPKVVFSQNARGAAFLEAAEGKVRVVFNGRPGKEYPEIGELVLSPDGSRLAYMVNRNDRMLVVVDGKEEAEFEDVGMPKFSPDGKHVLYNARKDDRAYLIVDGRRSAPFPSRWDELFSGDSKKVVLIHNSGRGGTERTVVITDLMFGNRHERTLDAVEFTYNAQQSRIAAIGLNKKKKLLLELSIDNLKDMKRGKEYDDITLPVFGPDGISIAYVANRDGKQVLVLNGREEALPEGTPVNWPAVRPDGKAAGIILAGKEGQFFCQTADRGGRRTSAYVEAGQPVYSPDSSRFAFVARRGKGVFVVVNGKEGPVYDMVVSPEFSPDNRYLTYRARKDGQRFVVVADADGRMLREHQRFEMVFPVSFTEGGTKIAYGVKSGEQLVQVVEQLP